MLKIHYKISSKRPKIKKLFFFIKNFWDKDKAKTLIMEMIKIKKMT